MLLFGSPVVRDGAAGRLGRGGGGGSYGGGGGVVGKENKRKPCCSVNRAAICFHVGTVPAAVREDGRG